MKNSISINIGGRIISIHDNAWQMKLAYIETLHHYFIQEEGCFEIINDIEMRIAELMQEIVCRQNEPINEINMQHIIRIMGTADEFEKLDTDDWDTNITSTDHCNAPGNLGIITSGYNLNKNVPSLPAELKLWCN